MPARTRWLPAANTMVISHYGVVDGEDLRATDVAALDACVGRDGPVRYLADFRRCDLAMTKEDVMEHARSMNALGYWDRIHDLRVAMIADEPRQTAFGMLFRTRAEESGLEVYATVEGAWSALGLDDASLDAVADLLPRHVTGD